MNILVCDDDALPREVVSDILKALGHTVETASDGVEALKMLKDKPYDVAVLDFLMPKKNGLDVFTELKSWPKRPKVVLISAISPKTLPALKEAAPDAVLEKPVKQKQLEKVLAQFSS